MQVDNRSREQTAWATQEIRQEEFLHITGNYVRTGGLSAPVILWFKEYLPEVYKKTYKFLSPTGLVVQKLTGIFTMDYSRASTAALMDIRTLEWSDSICSALKIDRDKLPDLYPSETRVGSLCAGAAAELSLPVGIPVCAGSMDSTASVIGAGCTDPGEMNLVIGTVSRLCFPILEPQFCSYFLNAYFHKETPYMAMAPTNGGGISFSWFAHAFGEYEQTVADSIQKNFYELFDLKAMNVPPGCKGLLYLPYLVGERSPMWDPNARGVFFGITPKHTKAFFLRSILEGVGHATLQNLNLMERELDCGIGEIIITGGGARSFLWCEIMANMLGRPIARLGYNECETRGDGFIAGLMAGVYHSYGDIKKQIRIQSTLQPNKVLAEIYLPLNELFKTLYEHLKDDFDRLAQINQSLDRKNLPYYQAV
jgi:xylulokinase